MALLMNDDPCADGLVYTVLEASGGLPPVLPTSWTATAVLHPFSPPPADDPQPDVPFFQLCNATFWFAEGQVLWAQIFGCEYGSWIYQVTSDQTLVSRDGGTQWEPVDVGWTLPSTNWFGEQVDKAVCAGRSYVNWMQAQQVDWWKMPVSGSNASTWLWFDAEEGLPFRLMFGQPPKSPAMGDPAQLAVLQMFSFTYFASFGPWDASESGDRPQFSEAQIPGFVAGNPLGYELVLWNQNFGMTTLMTPVDEASDPLPTRVLYRWASDGSYKALADRAQSTLMWYGANPQSSLINETALMFGAAPLGVDPPAHAGSSFLIDMHTNGTQTCQSMPLGQEPPDWARIPAVDGKIQACISDNPALCPGNNVVVISVIFPPSDEYPQGRYLWTWYSPFPGSDGSRARPVTFMESASTIAEGGTSLALADYFDYREFSQPIADDCFVIPPPCNGQEI